MENKLHQIFKNIGELEPSLSLEELILGRIDLERHKQLKIKLAISRIGFFGSLLAIIYTTLSLGSAFLASDFWSMLSLAYSDAMIMAINWKEFTFSLMESFPILTVTLILTPIFTLLLSISAHIDLSNNRHKYI